MSGGPAGNGRLDPCARRLSSVLSLLYSLCPRLVDLTQTPPPCIDNKNTTEGEHKHKVELPTIRPPQLPTTTAAPTCRKRSGRRHLLSRNCPSPTKRQGQPPFPMTTVRRKGRPSIAGKSRRRLVRSSRVWAAAPLRLPLPSHRRARKWRSRRLENQRPASPAQQSPRPRRRSNLVRRCAARLLLCPPRPSSCHRAS